MEQGSLGPWCAANLGEVPVREFFRVRHLSLVVGVELAGGDRVVVKIREPAPRLDACTEVQRRLFERGFPCPEPLTAVCAYRDDDRLMVASAERYVPGGTHRPASGRDSLPYAVSLHALVVGARGAVEPAELVPSPPWAAWNHREGGLFPWPDDLDVDLNSVTGRPGWIDDAAERARDRLAAHVAPVVVGHGDLLGPNLRWSGNELLVVHDWDSAFADTEAAVVGFCAATYPTFAPGEEATIEETARFLDVYQESAGRAFTAEEIECAWAAGVWQRAFDAAKQHAAGGPPRSLDETAATDRLRLAGY